VATGIKDFESSGIRGSNVGLSDPYEVRFTKRTQKHAPFTFICMVHPFMRGKVIVD
jgi:plastocyanin